MTTRHYIRVVAFVVLGLSTGALLVFLIQNYTQNSTVVVVAPVVKEEVPTTTPSAPQRFAPALLRIPKIDLESTFEPSLGLNADQTIEVPDSYDKVGWYRYGPTPGDTGPAVILGHVDSYQGPAVFYHLGELREGDKIYVTRGDGSEVAFEVMYFERYSVDEFPSEKVYGKTDGSELRLITCTGTYDKGIQRYSHNLVVYAKLVDTPSEVPTTP